MGCYRVWESLRRVRLEGILAVEVEPPSQVSPRFRTELASGSDEVPAAPLPETQCVFPMVGRVDYRSNWVPSHYIRWLLSMVGGTVVRFLHLNSREVWRMRALGRSFRYGVAFACEKAQGLQYLRCSGSEARAYDIAQARSEHLREREENWDNPAIDEVRHLLPDPDPALPLLEVRLYREEEPPELSDSEGEISSTTASEWTEDPSSPSMGESDGARSLEPGESEAFGLLGRGESDFGASLGGMVDRGSVSPGVGYRAVDGALVVVYGDEELWVPLLGWSLEEVGSIVDSIRSGDWTRFHEVVSWGSSQLPWRCGPVAPENADLPEEEIAYGSDQASGSLWGGSCVSTQRGASGGWGGFRSGGCSWKCWRRRRGFWDSVCHRSGGRSYRRGHVGLGLCVWFVAFFGFVVGLCGGIVWGL